MVIIGGGVIGLSCALRLRQAGRSVTVVERTAFGAEASWAAAGVLAPQAEASGDGPFLELCLASRALHDSFADELRELSGQEVGFLRSGALEIAFDEAESTHLDAVEKRQRARNLDVERLTPRHLALLEPSLSPRVISALRFPGDAQIDARKLVTALEAAVRKLGVILRIGEVTDLLEERGRCLGVRVEGAPLEAGVTVLAAGAWSALLPDLLPSGLVEPVRGQLLQLETRRPPLSHVVFGAGGYLVPRADGRTLVGSTMERVGFDKRVTASEIRQLLERAERVVPSLRDARFADCWAGFRPATPDLLPLLGEGPLAGLLLATGHYRNGILLAPVTAQIVAAQVAGESPPVDLAPFGVARFAAPSLAV